MWNKVSTKKKDLATCEKLLASTYIHVIWAKLFTQYWTNTDIDFWGENSYLNKNSFFIKSIQIKKILFIEKYKALFDKIRSVTLFKIFANVFYLIYIANVFRTRINYEFCNSRKWNRRKFLFIFIIFILVSTLAI